jgi:hypothetical protein
MAMAGNLSKIIKNIYIMNERKIQIANTKTQSRYILNTAATTLGELQDEMSAQGIDFTGMTFTEGLSKTQLLNRDSLLPTNVMFKGQPTNDLVMLLTNTTKQISSGAIDRKEAYRLVKEMGLQEAINEGEGINWTRCKTEVLETWINSAANGPEDGMPEVIELDEEPAAKPETKVPDVKTAPHPEAVEWYYMGLKAMVKSNLLYMDDIAVIADLTSELYKRLKEEQPKISNKDIDEMIANL